MALKQQPIKPSPRYLTVMAFILVLPHCNSSEKAEVLSAPTAPNETASDTSTSTPDAGPTSVTTKNPGLMKGKKRITKASLAESRAAAQEKVRRPEGPVSHLTSLVRSLTRRTECNRVMGCKVMPEVIAQGEKVIPELLRVLKNSPPFAPYRPVLLEVIGKIKSRKAMPALIEELNQPFWPNRVEACIALGRIASAEAVPHLLHVLNGAGEWTQATRAAAAFALGQIGQPGHQKHILLLTTPDAVSTINWGYTRVGFDLARELSLKEALPGARATLSHGDYFLRESGFKLIKKLDDQDSITSVAQLLGDKVPSLRRRSAELLKQWTGQTFSSVNEFRSWCDQQPDCSPGQP